METTRRGNYDSGDDFVLEYGELRFTFNERDFSERCEQAALKLGFVGGRLDDPELEDLVNLAVNGEIQDPACALGEHVNDCWPELVGPSDRSLVHWLRRLVFRSAWLDQRVKEGELDVRFDADDPHLRATSSPTATASPSSWRPSPPGAGSPTSRPAEAGSASPSAAARAFAIASAPSSPTSSSGFSVPLAARSSAGKRRCRQREVQRDDCRLPAHRLGRRRDHRQRSAVDDVARRRQRAAGGVRRDAVERVDQHDGVATARGDALGGVDAALDRLALGVRRRGERGDGRRLDRPVGLP